MISNLPFNFLEQLATDKYDIIQLAPTSPKYEFKIIPKNFTPLVGIERYIVTIDSLDLVLATQSGIMGGITLIVNKIHEQAIKLNLV